MTEPSLVCHFCGGMPASPRDDHAFYVLCDHCSLKYMTWPCPGCGEMRHGVRAHESQPCGTCETARQWAAFPQTVRDEIDLAIAERPAIRAIMRIRELTEIGLQEAMQLLHYRSSRS
ncbi:hypothetical protein [Lentzea californiensis]|uniref:hypothetical protein n=1 Tax=Lentzea californiensis TaxID=438851 RepID=UPI002166456D|nr:hypothetical protein [Lentzea californiensis]MCR3753508.1 hypothetical protein [Lentzea californiensis]